MLQDDVLRLLRKASEPLSGEQMSRCLGVSRAAVWKAVASLRENGYTVEAFPARGYRLTGSPDILSPGELSDPERVAGRIAICLPMVDSTNDECKRRAAQGAPEGLTVTADGQTGGRGRRGRSFQSLPGEGLYLSLLLRPKEDPETVSQITAWTAVAVCRAVERAAGISPVIKWPNDILIEGKKLCGILTEMGLLAESQEVDYVAIGMGINMTQTEAAFGPELAPVATSLALHGVSLRRAELARVLLEELDRMYREFPKEREAWLEEYRRRCVTVGRSVRVIRPDRSYPAEALGIDSAFSLRVRLESGEEETVFSGEVTVRGLLGYA